MASQDNTINLDYDEQNDVLYASRGSPQAALSYEVSKDIWLDYIPPNRAVVGITLLAFSVHYHVEDKEHLLDVARTVITKLLQQYPLIPAHQGLSVVYVQNYYVQIATSTINDAVPNEFTRYVGSSSLIHGLRIESSPIREGAHAR
jgi:hypothetical protein